MEIEKLKKIIFGNKNVSVQHLKQFSTKLTEETTNTSVISDLPKLIPAVFKYAVHRDKTFREAALPALTELAGLLDLNKHLKEKPWWNEMKEEIMQSVDVLMNLVTTGDDHWAALWITTVTMLGSDVRSELLLLNKLLKVVEKAFKMNDENVRNQGFECWCKLIDNFAINKQEINNKRRLSLLVIPLKANNHNTPKLCASKMKTWKHLLSKLDQHNEMTVQLLVTHFLEFMFSGVGSIAPACKTLNMECANIFSQMLQTPLLFRILPERFIKQAFVCIEHVHRDLSLCLSVWEGLLDNIKNNQWTETHVSELMTCLNNASSNDKLGKSKTFAHMIRSLYSGSHALPSGTFIKHLKTVLSLALEPHVLVNFTEEWCNELLNVVAETDPILLPHNIVGDIITKLNVLAVSEFFRDEKIKFLRGMWMMMTNIICKWMADDGQIGKNGNVETDLQNIHQLLFFGAAPLSSTWNKLQMKSWKTLYSECVKYFSLSTEVKCEKFVSDLVELLLEGVKDKKLPLHVTIDLLSIILEFHLSKDESSILPLMMEVAVSLMNSFETDTSFTTVWLKQYLKLLLMAARSDPALVNDTVNVTEKMLSILETTPLIEGHIEKTRNEILRTQIQLSALKPCRSQDRLESPGNTSTPPATSPTMTSFMHRLAKSKETKSKVGSPTPSQSSDLSSSPSLTPNSKKASSPFCNMKSEDFVFVPPKPRKILLTDHQKESLTTRKHDIPALYQDLSQDSSLSPFESLVTPAQAKDKEQMEKETAVHSPKNFKEVNFRSLSPKKSLITNLNTSTSEDKLQNNKENDCINNNNTKSPVKSNTKEIKSSGGAEDAPLKVLQDDQKRGQDHVPESVDVPKFVPATTRLRSRKSLVSDSNDNQSLTGGEENAKTCSDLDDHVDGSELVSDKATKDDVINRGNKSINEINPNAELNDVDAVRNITTPKLRGNEVKTPKRNIKKNKLSISVTKSLKKNDQDNKQDQNDKEKFNSSFSDSGKKSPSSSNTPKVSPRRLRKRKSGVTPILTGGEFIKKLRKSKSPLNYKDTPTSKTSKSIVNNETPIELENDNNLSKNDSLVLNDSVKTIKQTDQEAENIERINKSNTKSGTRKSKSASTNEMENIQSTENIKSAPMIIEESVIDSNKSLENQIKMLPENESDEVEIIAIIEKNKTESSLNVGPKNKVDLNILNDECIQLSSKSHVPLGNIACIDISFSPVKVVVERLPDIIISANKFDIQDEKESSGESSKEIEIVQKRGRLIKKMTLEASSNDLNCKSVDTSGSETIAREEKSVTLGVLDSAAQKIDEIRNERKLSASKGDSNKSVNGIINEEKTPSKNEGNENKESGNDKKLVGKFQSESFNPSSTQRQTRSMEKSEVSLVADKCNGDINSTYCKASGEASVNKSSEDSAELRRTPVKKPHVSESLKSPSTSESKISETINSPLSSLKQKSSENTPVKSGQKHLKQTQLPFTPIRKTFVSESKSGLRPEAESGEKQNSSSKQDLKEDVSVNNEASHKPKSVIDDETDGNDKRETPLDLHTNSGECNREKTIEVKGGGELSPSENMSETRQELQRTPEKASTSTLVLCLQRAEVETSGKSIVESPNKMTESEDIIASSQETDVTTQSILVSCRNQGSCNNSLKLLSKSPKKCENTSQAISSSERILRSSPLKADNLRFSGTPVKKSVCRRLDVEIEESPELNEVSSLAAIDEEQSPTNRCSEELSDDFHLLNGETETNKNVENHSLLSSKESEVINNVEDVQSMNANCSPRSHKNLKRFVESDASCAGSPKRTVGSLRFESNSSPVSSPNSRTSQMMELAKQEKERTISSPVSSAKRRRILPIRVGPVCRTPKSHIIQRTHNGPSEEWVRRTYSPSASPNSSILKRAQPISPDSSPPSSKKKRVSFLDPPVSESLLFSKANPGKGQIQRPDPKPDNESEELPSQGSVSVQVPENFDSNVKVFSPLKLCSSPLTDILERIVSLQWMSELEAQLKRLGVTTVGQLSSLPEETVERLPFIPPKLERLRKILQNYYNEISEKTDDKKSANAETSAEKCLSPDKDKSETLNDMQEEIVDDPKSLNGDLESNEDDEDVSSLAENIKHNIEKYPELVSKLGNTLNIDTVLKLLDFAVCKLKNENDTS